MIQNDTDSSHSCTFNSYLLGDGIEIQTTVPNTVSEGGTASSKIDV